jgi:hypothetical protein
MPRGKQLGMDIELQEGCAEKKTGSVCVAEEGCRVIKRARQPHIEEKEGDDGSEYEGEDDDEDGEPSEYYTTLTLHSLYILFRAHTMDYHLSRPS